MRVGAILSTVVKSPAEARAKVGQALEGRSSTLVADAELITSELVANALLHGDPPVDLAVSVQTDAVKVAVTDGSTEGPVVLNVGPADVHGRGMYIVASMADSWGATERRGGKTVWFSLCIKSRKGP